ncbi:MAG: tRNA pseudouridine(55) synthase TruB [Firmicutes bacterium]|nr:tRNA pseudouridine(55) synthase TruB [Bacillota bacterium]
MDGFLNILKPPAMTSHDVVKKVRGLFPTVKVGHGGTLDPDAVGVLPLLLGKATKLSSYLLEFSKVYRAGLQLGITTDTEDSSGKVLTKQDVPALSVADIEKVFHLFQGEIQQIPPMYSAVKQKGKKLYQYAREGRNVDRSPRKVTVYSLKIIEFYPPSRILFEVKCSKGTYIRTLCSQIGDYLGCGGHMFSLLRKEVGVFSIQDAHTIEELEESYRQNRIAELLLPLDYPFQNCKKLFLEETEIKALRQGRYLSYFNLLEKYGQALPEPVDETILPVYTKKSIFTLLARWKKDKKNLFYLKPEKVLKSC